jgi:hypothetical protein
MRGKLVIGLIISLVAISFGAISAFAECPEGKQPVNITTPSGKTKTLCIPDAAVQGIETAAENSGGTIVAAECPCWTSAEVNDLVANNPGFTCIDNGNSIKCIYDPINTFNYALGLKIEGSYYDYSICVNQDPDPDVIAEYITQEEVDACLALVESYISIYLPSK